MKRYMEEYGILLVTIIIGISLAVLCGMQIGPRSVGGQMLLSSHQPGYSWSVTTKSNVQGGNLR